MNSKLWKLRPDDRIGAAAPAPLIRRGPRRSFAGAEGGRLLADWVTGSLTADQEIRRSLTRLRNRSRDLALNDDYAKRFFGLLRTNVIGPTGIKLQSRAETDGLGLADETNNEIERGFGVWGKPGNCTVDGKLSWLDAQAFFIKALGMDGEVFVRFHPGYPDNPFNFAIEFVDPMLVDVNLNRRALGGNEVRLGIEVNRWRKPVAYYVLRTPPGGDVLYGSLGEPTGTGELTNYMRVPAEEILHVFITERVNQTRGFPWLHTALTRLRHLGEGEEAELVAMRICASKMGFFVSKTGDEYPGAKTDTGQIEVELSPGNFEQLPEGIDLRSFDPQHPNATIGDFIRGCLRGVASGLEVSYANLSNDPTGMNFSSMRSVLLEEREVYRRLQQFTIEHFCAPIFSAWLPMAMLTQQVALTGDPADYDRAEWRPRGWAWVDPLKDAEASVVALNNGFGTLADICAQEGRDYQDVLKQRAKEQKIVAELGLELAPVTAAKAAPTTEADQEIVVDAGGENV
jgi:lambda family phage portal protein